MDDLVAFVRARLDEDEAVARLADSVDPSPWYEDVEDGSYTRQREGLDGVGLVWAADNVGLWDRESSAALSMTGATATHVARHDPARVLREVEAKRRLLDLHSPTTPGGDECAVCDYGVDSCGCMGMNGGWPCATLALLALPYTDHPDYCNDWRP